MNDFTMYARGSVALGPNTFAAFGATPHSSSSPIGRCGTPLQFHRETGLGPPATPFPETRSCAPFAHFVQIAGLALHQKKSMRIVFDLPGTHRGDRSDRIRSRKIGI
jgi:hypothetical protein